jgi:hypothetical protein
MCNNKSCVFLVKDYVNHDMLYHTGLVPELVNTAAHAGTDFSQLPAPALMLYIATLLGLHAASAPAPEALPPSSSSAPRAWLATRACCIRPII